MDNSIGFNKLSDLLQLGMTYEPNRTPKIQGSRKFTVRTPAGLDLEGELSSLRLFSSGSVGVVIQMMGDLYMLAAWYRKTGSVSIYYIDRDKLTLPPHRLIEGTMELRDAVHAVREGVVASFFWKKDKWLPLALPI